MIKFKVYCVGKLLVKDLMTPLPPLLGREGRGACLATALGPLACLAIFLKVTRGALIFSEFFLNFQIFGT